VGGIIHVGCLESLPGAAQIDGADLEAMPAVLRALARRFGALRGFCKGKLRATPGQSVSAQGMSQPYCYDCRDTFCSFATGLWITLPHR